MSPNEAEDEDLRPSKKRPKITVACDRCRSPAGAACNYRATSSIDEIATSLSDRLAEVERKLTAFQKSQHVELLQSRPVSHANEDSGAQYDDGGHPIVHTGAASRLLYCWSRIGVMCTLPNLDPFTCLDEATEHASDAYSQLVASGESAEVFDQHASEGRLEQAVDSLATNGMGRLPSRLGVLLRHYIGFDVAKLRVNLPLVNGSQKPSSSLAFNDLCIATVAFLSAEGSTLGAVAGLQLLLARSWSLHTLSADYSVPGMLLLGSLLDTLALAPVQALGLLHVAGNIIERASRVAPVPPAYEKLKFILECDLLTEVDGGKDSYYEALVRDKVETAIRFYSCQFYLNRPILYFVTHEDLEDAYISRDSASVTSPSLALPPWIYDACCICIENAALALNLILRTPRMLLVGRFFNCFMDAV
ncbi:hypothetical protein B0A50_03439 [Salinomyces thailandicus]|uniref:Uncharacterized protein n=1 Tax=Salinomyces thailandicus TaxID=706561 RepID=A0A4U0U3F4_9PEZI|nr:hypothetical protein B0A50_03439 [Salinomyces thailandica]